MTQLIGTFNGGLNSLSVMAEDDDRLKPEFVTYKHPAVLLRDGCKDPVGYSTAANPWWPGGAGLMGDFSVDQGVALHGIWSDLPEITRGSNSIYFITGFARNASGTPTAGVNMKLFLTATDVLVSTTVSLSDGSYQLSTGFGGQQHYIVAYLSGGGSVPDSEGTTVNTLVPGIPGA